MSKRDRICKICGKECYGTTCKDCVKIGHYGRVGTWGKRKK